MDSIHVPAISVVMPVRNAMPYLDSAIESILTQTFSDFEFVIGDDASSDGSEKRLEWWAAQDPRIRLSRRETASGPAAAGNWVAELARCEIIARMDADDISLPHRLQAQYNALLEHPSAVMVGAIWEGIDAEGRTVREPDYAGLTKFDRFKRPFSQGSVMIRKSAFTGVGGYHLECDYWEDTDLFFRLYEAGDILISTQPLYRYRFSASSNRLHVSSSHLERQLALRAKCRKAAAETGSYQRIVAEWPPSDVDQSIPVAVFQNRASIEIWAGARSKMLLGWLKRGSKKHLWRDLPSLAFIVAAFFIPKVLRSTLSLKGRLANHRIRGKLAGKEFVRWGPIDETVKRQPNQTSS